MATQADTKDEEKDVTVISSASNTIMSKEEEPIEIPIADNTIYNVNKWYNENESSFVPPICNKLMYGGQLKIMFVGGPNTRNDFHIDCGDEFFFQIKGNMELPIYEKGKRKLIKINKGNIFLLNGRIPHSPQRPENNSLGLVIERTRYKKYNEMDAMRWYKINKQNGEPTDDPLFERWFFCTNLGKDLIPIVKEFEESSEFKTGETTKTSLSSNPPVQLNMESEVKEPFNIMEYIENNKENIQKNKFITVLSSDQTSVNIMTGLFEYRCCFDMETWFYVLKGECEIKFFDRSRKNAKLTENDCLIVSFKQQYMLNIKDENSFIMTVTMIPSQIKQKQNEDY